MGTFLIFVGTFLLSMFVGTLAALSLAEAFRADQEFIAVLFLLPAFSFVAILAFATGYALASRAAVLGWIAAGMAVLTVVFVAAPTLAALGSGSTAMSPKDVQVSLELIVSALVILLVQWGLVRRRFQRRHGEPQLSRWPWISTIVGGFIVLSPPMIAAIGTVLTQSRADWSAGRGLPAASLALFIAIAAISECTIRARRLRSQQLAAP